MNGVENGFEKLITRTQNREINMMFQSDYAKDE